MKCANCDAEIKDGSIYCPVCGKEAQIVNGYTSLEDDFLHSLLKEEKKETAEDKILPIQKSKQAVPVFVTGLILVILMVIVIAGKLFTAYKNDNSYDYQRTMAQSELADKNYEHALAHLAKALAIVPDDVTSRMEMAEIYSLQKEWDAAIVLLSEVIGLDPDNQEAYQSLIAIYEEKEQYHQIVKLAKDVKNKKILELFSDYLVEAPSIYPGSDIFYEVLQINIFSVEDDAIYYTLDGTDPITNGKRYWESVGIFFKNSGLYTIKAVCKNEKGFYSEVVSESYQIILTPETTETQTIDDNKIEVENIQEQ